MSKIYKDFDEWFGEIEFGEVHTACKAMMIEDTKLVYKSIWNARQPEINELKNSISYFKGIIDDLDDQIELLNSGTYKGMAE